MDEKDREDETKYGEFISSFFNWIPVSEQRKRAKRLENITKNEKGKSEKG